MNTYKFNARNLPQIVIMSVLSLMSAFCAAITPADWMAQVSDDNTVNELVMPGSHDAGMSETYNCAPPMFGSELSKTQSLNLQQQAEAGVRYFDLRPDFDKDSLVTYHRSEWAGLGWGCSGQSFTSIMDSAIRFLQSHPQEVLFFKISHTRNADGHNAGETAKRLIDLLQSAKYQPYLYKNPEANVNNIARLAISALRGKIVLVFADDTYTQYLNANNGFFAYHDGINGYSGLNVFDEYSNSNDLNYMRKDQLEKLTNNGGHGRDYLFLFSWTLTSQSLTSIYSLAKTANEQLTNELQFIQTNHYQLPNIVYLDFVDPQLTRPVIQLNFTQ